MQFFIIFSTFFFDSLDFHLDSTQNFQVHDMTINFSFILFFFFILMICLLWAMMHAIHGPSGWSISSHMRIILKGWPFGPRLFISFLSKERIVAQKCFREMGNFGPHAPRHQAKMTSRYHGLGTLFYSLKMFGRFEIVASLDAYQIINSISFKNSSFFVAWFFKNSRNKFVNQRTLWPIAWESVIKMFIRFFKLCPLGHQGFLFKWFQGENECLLEFPTMTTNSFRIPIVKKFENIFTHIFSFSFALGFIFFLEASIKFMMTKGV